MRHMMNNDLPYRQSAGIVLLNKDNKIFFAKRKQSVVAAWQMPQGGIEENEDSIIGAKRELAEETSITSVDYIKSSQKSYCYDFPNGPLVKDGRLYRGQMQKWHLFHFIGQDSEINIIEPMGGVSEFEEWKWSSPDEIINNCVEFRKNIYKDVLKEFGLI